MKTHFTLLLLIFFGLTAKAQINHGGQPYDWKDKKASEPAFIRLPKPDIAALEKEDKELDRHKEIPYRFGANIPVDFDLNNSGEWIQLENGDRVWRLGIESTGALTINFEFDHFDVPKGGKVFVNSPDRKRLLGSFTSENASAENSLGVGFVFSDRIVISYYEPAEVSGEGFLHINQVTHGYRNAFLGIEGLEKTGDFGQSGACNVNVNCPEGLPYGIEKRSVALIIVNGNAHCSGALINTTANDGTPYFLTANHCLGNLGNWVFYFNYETPGCANDGQIPDQSMSGATLKAKNENSDFGLILLNNDVPESYFPCYSGWDASDNPNLTLSAYSIHHPSGDVKKISFENDQPHQESIGGFANDVWYIDNWELGVTEGGSSGSPLFNQSGKIIGQLGGGESGCSGSVGNGLYDFYGRIGVSWDFGDSPETRLKEWLDPSNSGQLQMTNSCDQFIPENDISLGSIDNVDLTYCNFTNLTPSINVVNVGGNDVTSFTLHLYFNGNPLDDILWTGTIEPYHLESIDLGSLVPQSGLNAITVEVASVNNGSDATEFGNTQTKNTTVFENSQDVHIHINFDDYAGETNWKIVDSQNQPLYSGSGYSNGADSLDTLACFGIGCYSFIITDQFGDGICCSYGDGFYAVTDENGDTLATGGTFAYQDSTNFCITTVGIENQTLETISIYPNPTNGTAHISFGDASQKVNSIVITDALGRIVNIETGNLRNQSVYDLNTTIFQEGIYFISIKTDIGTIVRRLVVMR